VVEPHIIVGHDPWHASAAPLVPVGCYSPAAHWVAAWPWWPRRGKVRNGLPALTWGSLYLTKARRVARWDRVWDLGTPKSNNRDESRARRLTLGARWRVAQNDAGASHGAQLRAQLICLQA
jgi:hypothetical protein